MISYLNEFGPSSVSLNASALREYDVNGDGLIAPSDALMIINLLAAHASTIGGSKAAQDTSAFGGIDQPEFLSSSSAEPADVLSIIAPDVAERTNRSIS